MSRLLATLLWLSFTITVCVTQSYSTWMQDWSSSDALTYGVSISTSTIFDIVLPGANNAGMSFSSSDTNPMTSPSAQDTYVHTLNSLPDIEAQKQWAERQTGTILQLLESGVRFLDLQFQHEANTDTFYAYNGLLGRSVSDIITDITDFITNTGTQEVILIYLHNFITSDGIALVDGHLTDLLNVFVTDTFISSHCAISGTNDIRSTNIGDLITDNAQIILFTDEYPSGYSNANYFYDANTYLFVANYDESSNGSYIEGQLDQVSQVRSFAISNLRKGWPDDQLNLIYWTLDIGSSFTEQHLYASMLHFSSRLNNELNTAFNTYNKLWFANVVIVDFFEISDIMEQLLLLNHDYFNCKDSSWGNNGTACPAQTNLKSKYSTADISPLCVINTDLQTDCPRSCGVCPSTVNGGNPGDICSTNADCDGILYSFYSNTNGECFVRGDTQREEDNIIQESFCLTIDAQSSCTNHDVGDKCVDDEETVVDISNCNLYCTANWQCLDGFCNSEYSVCMTLLSANTTTDTPQSGGNQRYDFIVSRGAEQMLSDVAMFRPGDYEAAPDAKGVECPNIGPNCMLDGMSANPYLASLLGFAVIPFIMALTLCGCYTLCCCPCWCICDQCGKKCCCCHHVMKDPIEEGNKCKQFTPLGILAACLIVLIWACIDGIVNNAEMHDHIFGESNSVKFAVNDLFDEVLGRFNAVEPTAGYIIDVGIGIINDIFGILDSNVAQVDDTLDELYLKLDIVAIKYQDGVNLSTTFVNPFGRVNDSNISDISDEPFVLVCDYCAGISDQVREMKNIINSSLGEAIRSVDGLMNETQGLVDAKDMIENMTSSLFDTLNEVINTADSIQITANEYIDLAEEYDSNYREVPAMIFFIIPMGLSIFVILGVLMKNKWCFKCEWFCAMYCCGVPIMLLSWPFIFFAVLWGDICVRLDDFEQNLGESQLAQIAGLDNPNITLSDPRSMGLSLVNTCWHGGSPLDLFGNLTQNLNWDQMREQMDQVLDIDITSMFENADISQFQTGVDALTVNEFEGEVEWIIAQANSHGDYCGCGEPNSPFTWQNLYTPPAFDYCAQYVAPNYTSPILPSSTLVPNPLLDFLSSSGRTPYWIHTTLSDDGDCEIGFINASAAVQIYTILTDEANLKIAELKSLFGDAVFDTYDNLFKIAINLEDDISSISCMVEPLFQQFDIIIDNFTNCGFLGEAYGNFKEAGCVNLFDDWYKIARAMAVIAYISILIVFLSLCMDYVYGPIKKPELPMMENEVNEADDGSPTDGNVMVMAPTTHDPGASGGVELVTVVPVQPVTYVQPPTVIGASPGQITNYDDAAPSAVGAYMVTQPTQPKPEVAYSDVQHYAIGYDNEPGPALEPIVSAPIDEENDIGEGQNEGVGAATTENDSEYPVLPADPMVPEEPAVAADLPPEEPVVAHDQPPEEPVASAPQMGDSFHPVNDKSDDYDVL